MLFDNCQVFNTLYSFVEEEAVEVVAETMVVVVTLIQMQNSLENYL